MTGIAREIVALYNLKLKESPSRRMYRPISMWRYWIGSLL